MQMPTFNWNENIDSNTKKTILYGTINVIELIKCMFDLNKYAEGIITILRREEAGKCKAAMKIPTLSYDNRISIE